MLINNAGIASKNHPVDPILEADTGDMLKVFSTNVLGTVRVTSALLPLMQDSNYKCIVNLSSDLGSIEGVFTAQSAKVRAGGVASYRISKAASNMATRVFAAELADNDFTVVALSPGWVQTDMGSSGGRSAPLTAHQSVSKMLDILGGIVADAETPARGVYNGCFLGVNGNQVAW